MAPRSGALALVLFVCRGWLLPWSGVRAFRGETSDRVRSGSHHHRPRDGCFLVVEPKNPWQRGGIAGRWTTHLHPHRFHGGYDPSSPLQWTPQQAAEFTIFHNGSPLHAGMQLRTAIQHWSGADLAEFLTRLYLGQLEEPDIAAEQRARARNPSLAAHNYGETNSQQKKIVYEPQNIRSPRWKGLETREGILALKDLLRESLSRDLLSAQEIARFGEAFLLKEYRWPSGIELAGSKSTENNSRNPTSSAPQGARAGEVVFEEDTFYGLGHARTLARVLLAVRRDRGCNEFHQNDIALMLTLPEKRDEDRETTPLRLIEFLRTIAARSQLTEADKAGIVRHMALSGWSSGGIPRFMAELFPIESPAQNHAAEQMCRLQGDSFFDFPSAETLASELESKRTRTNAAAIAVANDPRGRSAKGTTKKKETAEAPAENSEDARESEQFEFDELVQSYWKKVEVKTPIKPKIQPSYGVPRTKSIKKRTIPKKGFGVSITKTVVNAETKTVETSKTTSSVGSEAKHSVGSKTKPVVKSKTSSVVKSKAKFVAKSKTKSIAKSETKPVVQS